MIKKIKIGHIVLLIITLLCIWFLFFRTKELTITYDGVENTVQTYGSMGVARNTFMRDEAYKTAAPALANTLSTESLFTGVAESVEEEGTSERYRENIYNRVDTESFESLLDEINKVIEELNGTIKVNNQNSNKKVVYDQEFYPRYQSLEFTVDNSVKDLSKIDETLKKWGNIRVSNSNKTSIEQELTNYEQQLKEMEEARKALQESKDRDWIAKQDADLAKRSERLKNQIENAKKQSTYKTYTIDIYELIKFRVNAVRYWYNNNYNLKDAVSNVLPDMVKLFALLIPSVLAALIFVFVIIAIYRRDRQKAFEDKLKAIKEEFDNKDLHFDIKL